MIPIAGYSQSWSYLPGDTVECKVSSILDRSYSARLVRIICADSNPEGPGILEEDLSNLFKGEYPSREQRVQLGSYARIPIVKKFPRIEGYAFIARIWPTLPASGEQAIVSLNGTDIRQFLCVMINSAGRLSVVSGAPNREPIEYSVECPLKERTWYSINLSVEPDRFVLLQNAPKSTTPPSDENIVIGDSTEFMPLDEVANVYIASLGDEAENGFYNGKIELPSIFSFEEKHVKRKFLRRSVSTESVRIAMWDFSRQINSSRVEDISPLKNNGELINCPARGMRGSNWTGKEMCWRHAPDEYGAIHFHDDDLSDCKWETDFSVKLPKDLSSGMYSVRLEAGDAYEDIPFFVRPSPGKPKSRICVIVPTFTYTVYINQSRGVAGEDYFKTVMERNARPWNPDEHQEFGLSTYNFHRDGSGIGYSTRLRPSLNMRPKFIAMAEPFAGSGMKHLPADTHLYAWLNHLGESFDMVTDDNIHVEGSSILEPYNVVLTTTHPEYQTRNTLDALKKYIGSGGNLMYLGGNGFYWKVAVNDEFPGVVEIRRAEGGIRVWAAEPGEYYNSLDGEYGGMWLRNGRPPQELVGIGFTAQGLFQGTYYRRNKNLGKEYDWIFEGVEDEVLGDFGLCGGGAAGFELDRAEARLGTPENAAILASSETYPEHFVLVPEEKLTHLTTWTGEPEEKLIRADMAYFDSPGGGAVFSTGSITYCGSLPWNNFDNNISKITENILRRFVQAKNKN